MPIQTIVALLVQFGPKAWDLIEGLIKKWSDPAPVTLEDFQALRKLGERTARQALLEALARAGIALDSPTALALLAATP